VAPFSVQGRSLAAAVYVVAVRLFVPELSSFARLSEQAEADKRVGLPESSFVCSSVDAWVLA